MSYTYAYLSNYVLVITIHVIEHIHGSNVKSMFTTVEKNDGGLVFHVKQFVSASADPGKLFHNIVQYHSHLYSSVDHDGYVCGMIASRTEVCDDRLSFNRNAFVNYAYT